MRKWLVLSALLVSVASTPALAEIRYPPDGKTPADLHNPMKGFFQGQPVEDVPYLIVFHAPEITGYVSWGSKNEDAVNKTSSWLREESREHAFLQFAFPNYDYVDLLDDPYLETDNYVLTKKMPALTDRAPRRRTIEAIRLWGRSVCDATRNTCPWFIAAIDTREPSASEILKNEIVNSDEDIKTIAYQFGLHVGDGTTTTIFESIDECDRSEPEYDVVWPESASRVKRSPSTFLGNEPAQRIYPGTLVKIADDMQSVSICGHNHPIAWTRPAKK